MPLSAPGLMSAALLVFIPTVGDYVTPTLVGGPAASWSATRSRACSASRTTRRSAAALSMVMMLVDRSSRLPVPAARSAIARMRSRDGLRGMRKTPIPFGLYAILFLIFLYGPVLLMPLFSFNDSIFAIFPLKGFTLQRIRRQLAKDGPPASKR